MWDDPLVVPPYEQWPRETPTSMEKKPIVIGRMTNHWIDEHTIFTQIHIFLYIYSLYKL